jgi:hypothetical protein
MATTETPSEARVEPPEGRRTNQWRANRWLMAVVVLAAALLAVGTWAIVDRSNDDGAAQPGPADEATVEMLEALEATTDGESYASFFTEDAVLEEHTNANVVTEGREYIARHIQEYFDLGWRPEQVGSVTQWDNFAATAVTFPSPSESTGPFSGMVIYELTDSGEISHSWAYGDYT